MSSELKFSDLQIQPGTKLDLRSEQYASLKGDSKFIGFANKRSLIVSTPLTGGKAVSCKAGTSVTIRLFINHLNCACAFRTSIQHVATIPYPHLFLEIPENIEVGEVRNSIRSAVKLDTLIKTELVPKTQSVLIDNLSTDGARIQSEEFLGIAGNKVNMSIQIDLLDIKHKVKISGIIRSCPNGQDNEKTYGIQFIEVDDSSKIIIYAYVMSQIIQ